MADFARALKFTLGWEGGFVDDPDDPGGRTNFGITEAVYREWTGREDADVAHISPDEVAAIYKANYWNPLCTDLLDPLALVVFDTAVNCGVKRAGRWLRDSNLTTVGVDQAARYVLTMRSHHYEELALKPSLTKFFRGWMNRLEALRDAAELAGPDFSDVTGGAS